MDQTADSCAYVVVENLTLGTQYASQATWCGFLIPFQYPYADVYPHYIDGQVRRVDNQTLGQAFQGPLAWQSRSTLQVSRRSNGWDAANDTAALKLAKVMEWINAQ